MVRMFNIISAMLKKVGLDMFILSIFAAILVAYLAPSVGVDHGIFSLRSAAEWGVGLIFFFYGLRLSPQKLKLGLVNVKLHFIVQISTFVVFPIVVLAAMFLLGYSRNDYLWTGTFFLASLPSTVSSSVVMVGIARGNIPAAIFNASISSLLGVFITPALMALYLSGGFDGVSSNGLGQTLLKLIFQVIVPLSAGVILNRKWGEFAERKKKLLRLFDETIIVLIVYTSFCSSFEDGMFKDFAFSTLLILSACMIGLFFFVFLLVWSFCSVLKFPIEDRITATFCGSKKSLVHGSVMSKVIFPDPAVVGIILLPTMLYHALQLIIASIIAQKLGTRKD